MSMFDDLDFLAPVIEKVKVAAAAKPTFPCQSCAGTGIYQNPRVHQPKSHCFACGGKGHFKTSQFDRNAKKAKKVEREATKLAEARAHTNEHHPGFEEALRSCAAWSDMARDMMGRFDKVGVVTENQANAILNMAAKAAATRARKDVERAEAQAARTVEVDLSPINKMFDHAKSSGLKKLSYRAEGLIIKPASAVGKNAGALYVKGAKDDRYIGKIIGTKFFGNRDATPDDVAHLHTIAADPIEAAKAYGKFTSQCSCCGRQLTDAVSIEMGIGPICAERWFGIAGETPIRKQHKTRIVDVLTEAAAVAVKYEYPKGMTAKEKQAYRAKMRRAK